MIVQKKTRKTSLNKQRIEKRMCFDIPIGTNKSPFGNQQVVASPKKKSVNLFTRTAHQKQFNVHCALSHSKHTNEKAPQVPPTIVDSKLINFIIIKSPLNFSFSFEAQELQSISHLLFQIFDHQPIQRR
jgi:hypothetical protein